MHSNGELSASKTSFFIIQKVPIISSILRFGGEVQVHSV